MPVQTAPLKTDAMALPKLKKDASAEEIAILHKQARKASELMRALSHETRLMILCLLNEQEMSVTEIEQIVGVPQATVSQQLARLRLEGFVATRREGRIIHYRIADSEVAAVVESLYDVFCKPIRE